MGDEDDFSKLPTEEKVAHKLFKVRIQGYAEALTLFRSQDGETSSAFNPYMGLVKKFVVDSNALAQEKGVEAALEFVKKASAAGRVCADVIDGVVTKCMNARAKTRSKGIEICLMYIEIEKGDAVIEVLLAGLKNKQPKIVIGCLETITQAISEFGVKVFNIRPVLKVLENQFQHSDKGVREQSKLLTVEIFSYIRDKVLPSIQKIKPVQLKELEDTWQSLPSDAPSPSRFTRSEQARQAAAIESGETTEEKESEGTGEPAAAAAVALATPEIDIDPLEFVEPVDVLAKLPADFYTNMGSPSWKLRKEALDALLPLAESPKMVDNHYGELVKALHHVILKDSNVMVVIVAAKCVAGLAKGLKKRFSAFTSNVITAVLEKFKEKKQSVVVALRDAADSLFKTTTLEAMMEDVFPFLENKNPNVKCETCSFLARCFTFCTPAVMNKATVKRICPKLLPKLDDTHPDVRNSAAEALGVILKIVGEKGMSVYLEGIDKTKSEKVMEASSKVEMKVAIAAPAKSAPPKPDSSSKSKSVKPPSAKPAGPTKKVATAPSSKPPIKKPAAASSKSKATVSKAKKGKGGGGASGFQEVSVPLEPELSSEEVKEKAVEILGENLVSQLENTNWKERLAACEEIKKKLESMDDINPFVMISILAGKKPGWKDSNFQVMKLKFSLVAYVASHAKGFGKRSIAAAISGLVDKLADTKIKGEASEALNASAEATSLNYVSTQVCKHACGQKNPKVLSESMVWLGESIKAFGFKINLKPHIDHVKTMLQQTNPAVRASAIGLLGVFHLYVGAPVRVFFEDEKPALLAQIDAQFEKNSGEKPPKPSRGAPESGGDDDTESEEQQEAVTVNVSDMIPRVDVGGKLKGALIKELGDKNWKVRGEALQKVSDIISEAKFILPPLGELPGALKARLSDSNKNLVVIVLGMLGNIAAAMGAPVAKYLRHWGAPILGVLADSKPQQRASAVSCLNSFYNEIGLVPFLETEILSTALATDNPFLRSTLLDWLEEKLGGASGTKFDLSLVAFPFVVCLEDRSADVRKKAQAMLGTIIRHVGVNGITRAAEKLGTASSKQNVMGMVEKWRQASGVEKKTKEKETSAPPPSSKPSKTKISSSRSKASLPTTSKKKEVSEETGPPLLPSNKEKRFRDEESLKIFKWNFQASQAPRDECVDQLKDSLQSCTSSTLHENLFHVDFKRHLTALEMLAEFTVSPENQTIVVSSLDLILKWITLRFFEKNTTVLIKCLEYLDSLFGLLSDWDYALHDLEASAFLPCLVMKVGDPKDVVRKQVRDLMRRSCNIYPAPKVYVYVSEGVKAKNSRQRTECLEEMGHLIARYTVSICPSKGGIAFIASNISDRDSAVRSAALNALVEVYRFEGEKMYKMAGNLSEKDISLLEERVKRVAGTSSSATDVTEVAMEKKPTKSHQKVVDNELKPNVATKKVDWGWDLGGIPDDLMEGLPEIPPPRHRDQDYLNLPEIKLPPRRHYPEVPEPKTMDLSHLIKETEAMLSSGAPTSSSSSSTAAPTASSDEGLSVEKTPPHLAQALDLVISQISSHDVQTSVSALKTLQKLLKEKENFGYIANHVDQLICAINLQVHVAMSAHLPSRKNSESRQTLNLLKYLINIITQFFHVALLAQRVSPGVLRDLFRCLLTLILDKGLLELKDSAQIVRNLNAIVLQIVTTSNPTNCFSALLQLLTEMSRLEGGGNPKLLQLVMKCTWRLTKILDKGTADVDVSHVLLDCHSFLSRHPPSAWASHREDTPLRTVKTLLHILVNRKSDAILDCLGLIPNATETDVYRYITRELEKHSRKIAPTAVEKVSASASDSPLQQRRKDTITPASNQKLSEIFARISSPENEKEGLDELHDFLTSHPEVDINKFLDRGSPYYKTYILRCLDIRQGAAERKRETDFEDTTTLEEYKTCLKDLRARMNRLNEIKEKELGLKVSTPITVLSSSDSAPSSEDEDEPDAPIIAVAVKPSSSLPVSSSSRSQSRVASTTSLAALKERLARINARK
ncbi:cytoskeleton-associated protein 5-like isoform X2 [Oscarella lobularis]|uniref:cytoskeleton-associated protein 5-like isoform X2 n=1 Tax=Oscarella lobularis TaxID=121494 RepID=UPI00331406B7